MPRDDAEFLYEVARDEEDECRWGAGERLRAIAGRLEKLEAIALWAAALDQVEDHTGVVTCEGCQQVRGHQPPHYDGCPVAQARALLEGQDAQ